VEDVVSEEQDKPLAEDYDLGAWDAQEPPRDFADKVLSRVREEARDEAPAARADARPDEVAPPPEEARRIRRIGLAGGAVAALALAAAVALRVGSAPPAKGEAIAQDRIEVSIGKRARAVLEPGAKVAWDGDDVVQPKGDVFYRVEPGARFRVHTPAGDVEVKGTCFAVKVRGESNEAETEEMLKMHKRDMKAGAVGAALSALAFVAVYEGKVAVSHASEEVDLAAGESASLGPDGARKTGDVASGQKAFDAKTPAPDEPLAQANDNLVGQVKEYKDRLEAIAKQKSSLEDKLAETQKKLEAAQADGAAPRARNEYDLDANDWAELARQGKVKFRTPCYERDKWNTKADKLDKLGLAPQDGAVLTDAYERSWKRVWDKIRPLCAQALNTNGEILDKLGVRGCEQIIYDVALATDEKATREAHTEVAEIRAGLRPEPGPNDKVHPVLKMFLVLTGANGAFESDLAKSFGPEEAHRLAYSDQLCISTNGWGGGVKREPDASDGK
jgi:ferric-dicitrate binding protein FerR (iron transport regulator)